jgi:hypothetical protein
MTEDGQHEVDADEELTTKGPEERELLRRHRAAKLMEARRVAAWAAPVSELSELLNRRDGSAGRLFIARAQAADGWTSDQEIDDFVIDLLTALNWQLFNSKTHGPSWARR